MPIDAILKLVLTKGMSLLFHSRFSTLPVTGVTCSLSCSTGYRCAPGIISCGHCTGLILLLDSLYLIVGPGTENLNQNIFSCSQTLVCVCVCVRVHVCACVCVAERERK